MFEVGACPLQDNDPVDPHRYELTLWTSMRFNAGTTSKVSITLYGEENDSDSRVLQDPERSTFQVGMRTWTNNLRLDCWDTLAIFAFLGDGRGGIFVIFPPQSFPLQVSAQFQVACCSCRRNFHASHTRFKAAAFTTVSIRLDMHVSVISPKSTPPYATCFIH